MVILDKKIENTREIWMFSINHYYQDSLLIDINDETV